MARIEASAESRLPFFLKLPMVGIARSIRIKMIAMTISNSIKVKPLGGMGRRERLADSFQFLRFIRFQFLCERSKFFGPSEKILQRMDAKGKWDARTQLTAFSYQLSAVSSPF